MISYEQMHDEAYGNPLARQDDKRNRERHYHRRNLRVKKGHPTLPGETHELEVLNGKTRWRERS